jgi:hypothetical protein
VIYYDQIPGGVSMIILQQGRVYRKVMGFQADRCCEALSESAAADYGRRRGADAPGCTGRRHAGNI